MSMKAVRRTRCPWWRPPWQGLTYTVELLDRLEYAVTNGAPADSNAEGNTAQIICTPYLGRRRIGRCWAVPWRPTCWQPGSLSAENAVRLDSIWRHGTDRVRRMSQRRSKSESAGWAPLSTLEHHPRSSTSPG